MSIVTGTQTTQNSQAGAMVPTPITDEGELILKGRIRNPASVAALWYSLWFADFGNMRMRTMIQRLLDGFPPYSDNDSVIRGQGKRANVAFGHVRRAFDRACSPYNEVLDSMVPLFSTPTTHGTEAQRQIWEPAMAEIITNVLKGWPKFHHLWQQTVRLFKSEAVALEYHDDEYNWQWNVEGMQKMKFPRDVRPCVEDLDVWVLKDRLLCSQLFKNIKNPKIADKLGWNVEAVKAAILKAAPQTPIPSDTQNWEEIYKNLDILYAGGPPVVEIVHCWAQELDGTVSHYMSRGDGVGEFLYQSTGKFRDSSSFMTMYIADVGTNGDLHSIRGLPHHLFNAGVMMDRILSAAADAVVQSATAVIKVGNEDALNSTPYRMVGPMMALNEGCEFVEQHTPDFADTLLPYYQTVKNIFDADAPEGSSGRAGQPTGGAYVSDSAHSTEILVGNQLTSAEMHLFFNAKQQMFRQVLRRMIRESYSSAEPGGKEVNKIKTLLLKAGIPLKAFYEIDIDSVEINVPFGHGSTAARRMMISDLMRQINYYDKEAQQMILRAYTAIFGSAKWAKELVPFTPGLRPPPDLFDANMENTVFLGGNQLAITAVHVLPNQDHEVHCGSHLTGLTTMFQLNSEGQLPPDQVVTLGAPLHAHATEHWQLMNPTSQNYKAYKETLQQMNEFLVNQGKKMAAEQQKAQAEGAAGQGGEPMDTDPGGLLRQSIQAAMALKNNQAKADIELAKGAASIKESALKQALLTQKLQQNVGRV